MSSAAKDHPLAQYNKPSLRPRRYYTGLFPDRSLTIGIILQLYGPALNAELVHPDPFTSPPTAIKGMSPNSTGVVRTLFCLS
ncbi:hypothetical protein PABG_11521 [Paracoccidioides brasiliensis Pb03]|nr:hypothetical protein PABG_11521 [Paracoccidioides brasiliensis Pb03]